MILTRSKLGQSISNHIWVAMTAWLSRAISLIINIFIIRILITQLGSESYAVFVLLSGLITWFMLADMGIGVSVQNCISERRSNGLEYKSFILAAVIIALVVWIFATLILILISIYFSPRYLVNFDFLTEYQKITYFVLTGFLFLGIAIGSVSYKIWFAEQKGFLPNIMPAIASIITFFLTWILPFIPVEKRLLGATIIVYMPTMVLSISSLLFLLKKNIFKVSLLQDTFKIIINRGLRFSGLSLMAVIAMSSDYFFVSQFLSIEETIIYNMLTKIFGIGLFLYSAILTAFWSVCSELLFKHEWACVKKYVIRYQILGAIIIFVILLILLIFKPIILNFFAPDKYLYVDNLAIYLFGLYYLIRIWTDMFSTVFFSINKLGVFYTWIPIQILISIPLQMILSNQFGMNGLLIGLIVSLLATTVWVLPYKFIKESSK